MTVKIAQNLKKISSFIDRDGNVTTTESESTQQDLKGKMEARLKKLGLKK